MSASVVSRCASCQAVINVTWKACPSCSTSLDVPSGQMSAVVPGAVIFWQRGDGTRHSAVVEFLHTDTDGSQWAFCTTADGWAAVNIKFLTVKGG